LFIHSHNEQILKIKETWDCYTLIFLGGSPKNLYSKISNSPMPCASETKHEDYMLTIPAVKKYLGDSQERIININASISM
jgi:hypothetical protein